MQALLEQLLKVVLALVTLIATYFVGQGVISNSTQTTTQTQSQSQVQTQTTTQTQTSTPVTPTAPGSTTTTATTGSTAGTDTTTIDSTSVAVAGASNVGTSTTTQNTTNTTATTAVAIVTDNNAYGAGSYVQDAVVADAFYVAPNGSDSNPGTEAQPWATIQHAADALTAGQTVYVRGGTYNITERIETKNSGTASAWITFAGYPGEQVVIDASNMGLGSAQYPHDLGAFFVSNNVQYVRVANLQIHNSHAAGITVCQGKHVEILGNTTNNTYSPGISANSTYNHDCDSADVLIAHNTVINSNNLSMALGEHGDEAPHEAISIMGTNGFEIAYNHIHDTNKEGIDVKERSTNGVVHHNLVENIRRQCFYVDAWYGTLSNIEWYANIGRSCGDMGFAISVEDGAGLDAVVSDVSFHHNLLYNNGGTGIYFSRFNADGLRKNIKIYNNTVYNNAHGEAAEWITGGLALLSTHVADSQIYDNIFADNGSFQMGANTEYGGMAGLASRNITLDNNLINGPQGNADMYDGSMQAVEGTNTIAGDPLFTNPGAGDFTLQAGSPAVGAATDGGNIGAL